MPCFGISCYGCSVQQPLIQLRGDELLKRNISLQMTELRECSSLVHPHTAWRIHRYSKARIPEKDIAQPVSTALNPFTLLYLLFPGAVAALAWPTSTSTWWAMLSKCCAWRQVRPLQQVRPPTKSQYENLTHIYFVRFLGFLMSPS